MTSPKHQLLLRPSDEPSHARFAERVRARAVPQLLEAGPSELKLTLTDTPPPRLAVQPFSRRPVALVSWRGDRPPPGVEGFRVEAYRVEEALPVAYERTWPDGEPTPGVSLLTLFRRKRDLDDDTFLRRWHGGHTPLSLEIHPLWCYVRNVVLHAEGDAEPWDGIVEEHFRRRAELLDPRRFFGGGRVLPMLRNMVRVGADIAGFMDLRSMQVHLATERWIRS